MDIGGPNRYGNSGYLNEGNAAPAPSQLTQQERREVDEAVNFLRDVGFDPTPERVADTTNLRLADVRAYMGGTGSSTTEQAQHLEEPNQDQGMSHDFESAFESQGGGKEDTLISPKGTHYGPPDARLGGSRMSSDVQHSRVLLPGQESGFNRPTSSGVKAFQQLPEHLRGESEQGMSDLLSLTKHLKPGSEALTGTKNFLAHLKDSNPGLDRIQRKRGGTAGTKRAAMSGSRMNVPPKGTEIQDKNITTAPTHAEQTGALGNDLVGAVVERAFRVQGPHDPRMPRFMELAQHLRNQIDMNTNFHPVERQLHGIIQQGLRKEDPAEREAFRYLARGFQEVMRPQGG